MVQGKYYNKRASTFLSGKNIYRLKLMLFVSDFLNFNIYQHFEKSSVAVLPKVIKIV